MSKKYNAKYKYVECLLSDVKELDLRLRTRQRLISQTSHVPPHLVADEAFQFTVENSKSKRPSDDRYFIVDTARTLDSCIDEVIEYIND